MGSQVVLDLIASSMTFGTLLLMAIRLNGSVSESGKILIDRRADWGDLGIVALANRPERFVLINEFVYRELAAQALPRRSNNGALPVSDNQSVRGTICDQGFEVEACRNSILREGFYLVVLSSSERVRSFQAAFHAPSWTMGDYHIFAMKPLPSP